MCTANADNFWYHQCTTGFVDLCLTYVDVIFYYEHSEEMMSPCKRKEKKEGMLFVTLQFEVETDC